MNKPVPPAFTETQAIANFQKRLERSPNAQRLHMLLAMDTGMAPPDKLPPGSITKLFDKYADGFDEHLRDRLKYRVPDQIAQKVTQLGITRPDTLDLGCGTGLCGEALLRIAKSLHGIDISSAMIARARSRVIYNQLDVGELHRHHPKASPRVRSGRRRRCAELQVGDLDPDF